METLTSGILRQHESAKGVVAPSVALAFQALPLELVDGVLRVAFADPIDEGVVQRFAHQTGVRIQPVSVSEEALRLGLYLAYDGKPFQDARSLIEEISGKTPPKTSTKTEPETPAKIRRNAKAKTLAITGGKGGVGKTAIAANLGVALAQLGFRVGLLDCDFGLSNLNVALGLQPKVGLKEVLSGSVKANEAFTPGPCGLRVLAINGFGPELANLNYSQMEAVGAGVDALSEYFDFLIFDTAAGVHNGVMSLLCEADEVFLVLSSDPSSVQDAYVTVRTLLEIDPGARIKCVMNSVRSEAEAKQVYAKFHAFLAKHGDPFIAFAGCISWDRCFADAAQLRQPLILSHPKCQATRDLRDLACYVGNVAPEELHSGLFSRLFGRKVA